MRWQQRLGSTDRRMRDVIIGTSTQQPVTRAIPHGRARWVGLVGAFWADLVGIQWVTWQADASQRQVDRAKSNTTYGADRAIGLEFTAVGVCIAHRLQIPAHRLTHQRHPFSATHSTLLTPFHADPLCGCLTMWTRRAGVIPSHGALTDLTLLG